MTPETERKPTSLPVAMGEDPTTANSTVEPCKRQIKWRFELALLLLCITAAVAVIAGTVVSRQDKSSTSSSDQTNDANVEPSNEPQGRKCFEDRDELLGAVQDYLGNKRHQVTCKYGPISNWCVDQITNFTAIFRDQKDFNESLDGWEMSQATTLREMFSGCSKFNQDLHYWDVSNVEDMSWMFYDATSFDGSVSWGTSNLKDTSFMFTRAISFSGKGIEDWDVSKVWNLFGMFNGASAFRRDLCAWGPTLPDGAHRDYAFTESGCDITTTPDLEANPPGPFCFICV